MILSNNEFLAVLRLMREGSSSRVGYLAASGAIVQEDYQGVLVTSSRGEVERWSSRGEFFSAYRRAYE